MKSRLDCLECTVIQALRAARVATDDEDLQRLILNDVAAAIPGLDMRESPAELSRIAYRLTAEYTGVADPYKDLKRAQNEFALTLEDEMRERVRASDNPLQTALHLSAAGNIIDLGTSQTRDIDVHGAIRQVLDESFAVDHTQHFLSSLTRCQDLLFLLDNAGEIVFDKLLIEELQKHTKVTAVVKGAPVLNDVTIEDAEQVKLTDVCEVMDNGGPFIGAPLRHVPKWFLERMRAADVIVGKGQGNYETVDEFPGDVFLILRAKCQIIANHMGVGFGQVGLISTRVRGLKD